MFVWHKRHYAADSPAFITAAPSDAGVDFSSSRESYCNCLRASLAVSSPLCACRVKTQREAANFLLKAATISRAWKIHKLLPFVLTHLPSAKCFYLTVKSEINMFCGCSSLSSGSSKGKDHSTSAGLGFGGFLPSICDCRQHPVWPWASHLVCLLFSFLISERSP